MNGYQPLLFDPLRAGMEVAPPAKCPHCGARADRAMLYDRDDYGPTLSCLYCGFVVYLDCAGAVSEPLPFERDDMFQRRRRQHNPIFRPSVGRRAG